MNVISVTAMKAALVAALCLVQRCAGFSSMPMDHEDMVMPTATPIPEMVPDCRLVGPSSEVTVAASAGYLLTLEAPYYESVEAGATFDTDGAFCTTTCSIIWPAGSMPEAGMFYTYSELSISMHAVSSSDTADTLGIFCPY